MTMINPIEDLMNYYHFQLVISYCIIGILILTTIALLKTHIKAVYSIIINALSLVALVSKQFFLGVIADNMQENVSSYSSITQERILLIVGFIIVMIQFWITIKEKK